MSIFAVLAVDLFAQQDPENFGNLSRALFTILLVTTGEGWSEVAKQQMGLAAADGQFNRVIGFFFVIIVIACGLVMLNVVIAVLLDAFLESVSVDEASQAAENVHAAIQILEPNGPMDRLLGPLTHYGTQDDLEKKIASLFKLMDVDDDGLLTKMHMREGLKKVAGVDLSDEDWTDMFLKDQDLRAADQGCFTLEQFTDFILAQLKLYVQRDINSAILEAQECSSASDSAVLFVLKNFIVETEELMHGQQKVLESHDAFTETLSSHARFSQGQEEMISHILSLDTRVQDVDQKMDVVLRLLNTKNTQPPVVFPSSEASLASHLEEEEAKRMENLAREVIIEGRAHADASALRMRSLPLRMRSLPSNDQVLVSQFLRDGSSDMWSVFPFPVKQSHL